MFSEGSVCFVSRDGHASIVKALIDAGADVKVVNTKTKESPLHFAVQYRGKVGIMNINDLKFSDIQVWPNSVDRVYTLCHSICTFRMHYSMVKPPLFKF